jgi:hypothetical protein
MIFLLPWQIAEACYKFLVLIVPEKADFYTGALAR